MFYFVFYVIVVLSMFNLLSVLLRGGIVYHFIMVFYPYDIDSDR